MQLHCIWYNMYLYKVCHAKIRIIMPIMLMFEARINSGLGLQQKKDRWVWKKFMLHPGTSCWVWKRKTAEGCFWLKWIKYNCKINLIQVYYCELQDNICMGANFLQELLLCIMVLNTIVIHGNYDIDSKNCEGSNGKNSFFWKGEHW